MTSFSKKITSVHSLTLAIALCFTGLSLVSPSHAGLFDDDEARKAILDLRGKVEAQNKEILAKQAEQASRTDQLEQTTRGMLQLQNQIEQLRGELARLRGQLELQGNELSTVQQGQKEQKDQLAAAEAKVKRFEPVAAQVDGRQILVDPAEKRRYDAAIALVRSGDFRNALVSLTGFQAAHPDSGYSPSVAYWVGSSHYALKDYKPAITTFQSLITAQPDYPRTIDAIFTMGLAQIESGDRRAGKKTLEGLVERYPDNPLAQSAKERLSTLKL
jgi:tol-pal system protein YbgF